MATQQLILNQQWVQITDGTQNKTFQVISGTVIMRDQDAIPEAGAPGHQVTGWMTISQPTKCWVRASGSTNVTIILS
ncbi:hypothetical protein [Pseudescherichia vulneris]|uniref:hypothetical protein n=1 Tax=Pseudescherichia vulneris TaxID=566 RepID=UPI0028D5665F|nr:hypothetical protein [Pseudescherichia vulneris]